MGVAIVLAAILLALPALVCLQAGGWFSILGGAACLVGLGLYFLALAGRRQQEDEDDFP